MTLAEQAGLSELVNKKVQITNVPMSAQKPPAEGSG